MQKYDEEEFLRDAEEMKNKVSQIKLSDDFKAKLQEKMDLEFEKETVNSNLESDNKIKLKFNNLFFIPKFVVALCLIVLVSGCITFADEIESFVSQIFSNTDRELEMAIENGNYRELDMDYIESNGVAIKVDYIIEDEDSLYIAFNVKTEEEYKEIDFNNYRVKKDENDVIYDSTSREIITDMNYFCESINKRNVIIICKLENFDKKVIKFKEKLEIEIFEITCIDINDNITKKNLENCMLVIKKDG